jgi:mRNA interferase MazF
LAKDTPTLMPSTTTYQPGDIVLVDFPFTTSGRGKPRPALVILDTGDADIVSARITTQSQNTTFDVVISDWQSAGLLAASTVRVHKLATLAKSRVQRRLGALSASDRITVANALQSIVASW